ncbi:hypothetical protein [Ruegeria arenilitoris]|uniref:hypothetical protein n=1 Tax=Ruegeria arenilitoris TaxID=1173585 RepID=UPI003F5CCD92
MRQKAAADVRATEAYLVPAMCDFMGLSTLRLPHTAGLMGRDAASQKHYEGLLWAARESDPLALYLSGFSDDQGILEFDADRCDPVSNNPRVLTRRDVQSFVK